MSNLTPKEVRELWAQALESGEYKQGDGQLAYDDPEAAIRRYCCLGVACSLAVTHGVIDQWEDVDETLDNYLNVVEWLGLSDSEGNYGERSLIDDNDSGNNFAEIAATIRAEPEGLVVA